MFNVSDEYFPRLDELRRDAMRTPDEVAAMLRLRALGFGERRIATRVLRGRSTDEILHALTGCPERMLVLERAALTGPDEALFAIAAGCGVPVLLLDGEAGAG